MQWGALTHKVTSSFIWFCKVTWQLIWYPARSSHAKIYINLQWNGLFKSRKKLNTLYLYLQKAHKTKLGKVLIYCERFQPLKPHDQFGHLASVRYLYLIFIRVMATKHGKMLTLEKEVSTQKIKSSLTSCIHLNIQWKNSIQYKLSSKSMVLHYIKW